MSKQDHAILVLGGDTRPRIFKDQGGYVAWTATNEGPLRPDFAAAAADLLDMMAA
jgi:hypothetical protein